MALLLALGAFAVAVGVVPLVIENSGSDDSKPAARAPAAPAKPRPAPRAAAAPRTPPAAPVPAATGKPLDLSEATAKDYDPLGDKEHPEQAKLAIDGDPSTNWTTETYDTGALNKPGVGLYVDLGDPPEMHSLKIDTPRGGFKAAVYGSTGAKAPAAWPSRQWKLLAPAAVVRDGKPIALKPATTGRLLVWITDLGGREKAEIGEIRPAQ
jgi:hypothetical protein